MTRCTYTHPAINADGTVSLRAVMVEAHRVARERRGDIRRTYAQRLSQALAVAWQTAKRNAAVWAQVAVDEAPIWAWAETITRPQYEIAGLREERDYAMERHDWRRNLEDISLRIRILREVHNVR